MNGENFAWRDVPGEPGIAEKLLGTFTERRIEVAFLRLVPGAAHVARGPKLLYVLSGSGVAANHNWETEATLGLEDDEEIELRALTPSEMYVIGLPH